LTLFLRLPSHVRVLELKESLWNNNCVAQTTLLDVLDHFNPGLSTGLNLKADGVLICAFSTPLLWNSFLLSLVYHRLLLGCCCLQAMLLVLRNRLCLRLKHVLLDQQVLHALKVVVDKAYNFLLMRYFYSFCTLQVGLTRRGIYEILGEQSDFGGMGRDLNC